MIINQVFELVHNECRYKPHVIAYHTDYAIIFRQVLCQISVNLRQLWLSCRMSECFWDFLIVSRRCLSPNALMQSYLSYLSHLCIEYFIPYLASFIPFSRTVPQLFIFIFRLLSSAFNKFLLKNALYKNGKLIFGELFLKNMTVFVNLCSKFQVLLTMRGRLTMRCVP